jgi:hypothetical protein
MQIVSSRVPSSMHVALLRTRNNQELHPPRSRAARRHSSSSDSSTTTTTIHQGKPPILHHKAREGKTAQQASGCDGEQKRRQAEAVDQRRQRRCRVRHSIMSEIPFDTERTTQSRRAPWPNSQANGCPSATRKMVLERLCQVGDHTQHIETRATPWYNACNEEVEDT